jgi:predicted nuclease of predicted toxin-antitoxin system
MKVLVDMNLSPVWATFLSAANVPTTHWSQVGAIDAIDEELMAYAAAHAFVVLTHDLDFGAILAASRGGKPSVIQIRSDDLRPEFIGRAVLAALRGAEADLEAGALITVEPGRTRLRILPLKPS